MGDTGDEIADVARTRERRQGAAVGRIGISVGGVFAFAAGERGLKSESVSLTLAGDGRIGMGGAGHVRWRRRGGR
jgi:hypothetical protein